MAPTPDPDQPSEPSLTELMAISELARLQRLIADEGLDLEAAIERVAGPESAEAYAERGRAALVALEARMLSPAYLEEFNAAQAEPDPLRRAERLAALKLANFATLDMVAVHRVIAARNRQWRAEGILPPTAAI
jgi:hypothetical protein